MAIVTTTRVRSKTMPMVYNLIPLGEWQYTIDPANPGPWPVTRPALTITTDKGFETISDEILVLPSNYAQRTALLRSAEYAAWRRSFKNTSHKKTSLWYTFGANINYMQWNDPKYPPGPYYGYLQKRWYDGAPVPSAYAWNSLAETPTTAWDLVKKDSRYTQAISMDTTRIQTMMKKLTSDPKLLGTKTFSIANFLLEFKETLTLVNLLKFKLTDFAKQGADKHLAYNFGLKPLISDIEAIYDIVKNMNRRIDSWNAGILKGTKVYNTHITLSKEKFTYNSTFNSYREYLVNNLTGEYEVIVKDHCYFTPQLIQKAQIGTLLEQFTGLRNPAGIVWEAIPFSFLVDWLFHVGDMISQFESQPSILKITAATFGYSISVKGSSINEFKLNYFPYTWINGSKPTKPVSGGVQFHNYVSYDRVRINPASYPTIIPLNNEGIDVEQSANHIALVGSLLLQRALR